MSKKWLVIYTKSHCEKKVAALLSKKKIENYCPLNRTTSIKGFKKKILFEPLFPSFVFVRISDAEMGTVRQISSVINFIYWLGTPAVVKDAEIENVKLFTDQYSNISLEKINVNNNGIVRFISEPHIDINANSIMVSVKSNFKLLLPSLGYLMVAEIEKSTSDSFGFEFEKIKMVS
jgi:transcription antitermination factor NusG